MCVVCFGGCEREYVCRIWVCARICVEGKMLFVARLGAFRSW